MFCKSLTRFHFFTCTVAVFVICNSIYVRIFAVSIVGFASKVWWRNWNGVISYSVPTKCTAFVSFPNCLVIFNMRDNSFDCQVVVVPETNRISYQVVWHSSHVQVAIPIFYPISRKWSAAVWRWSRLLRRLSDIERRPSCNVTETENTCAPSLDRCRCFAAINCYLPQSLGTRSVEPLYLSVLLCSSYYCSL